MVIRFLLSCLFFCILQCDLLTSDEGGATTPLSLADFEGEPSSIVNGCVNAITGDFINSGSDLVINGVEPLSINRFYSSLALSDRSLGNGWSLSHHGFMEVATIEEGTDEYLLDFYSFPRIEIPDTETHAIMTDEWGSSLQYHCDDVPKKDNYLKPTKEALKLGVTNCSKGMISGRTNCKNTKIYFTDKKYHAYTGSGSHYIFDQHKKDTAKKDVQRLLNIQKANGLKILYEYDKHHLRKINMQTNAGSELCSIAIDRPDCPRHQDEILLTSHDNRQVRYTFFDEYNNAPKRLEIKSSSAPTEVYTYSIKHHHVPSKIIKRELPESRFLEIDYYLKENNSVGGENIFINSRRDLRCHRVKCLKQPVGTDAAPITTYRFVYETGDKGKGSEKPLEGNTKVYDALDHQTIYKYDKFHRLTCIEKYKGTQKYALYTSEKLTWGDKDSRDHTNLICRTLENSKGEALVSRYFIYDKFGNIIESILAGNLSGMQNGGIVFEGNGKPDSNRTECYKEIYNYSLDGLNLLVFESNNLRQIEYEYVSGTDKIRAKYTKAEGSIRKRQFYEYDENGALSQEVTDNGSQKGLNNFDGVSERKVITIKNTKNIPRGLPEIVEEQYYDIPARTLKLIHKTINQYDVQGHLINQQHVGSDCKLAYTLYWVYDERGNVIEENTPLGQVIKRRYDANNNKFFEQGPSSKYSTRYSYDYSNRLIFEDKTSLADNIHYTQRFGYDYLNNRTSSKDIYGNQSHYSFDEFGREIKARLQPFLNEQKAIVMSGINKTYNELGQVTQYSDAHGILTLTTYNIRGKPVEIRYADGSKESNFYDLNGNLKKSIDKNETYTVYVYDYQSRVVKKSTFSPSGTLIQEQIYVYDAFHLLSETDTAGYLTYYHYDGAGRLIEKVKEDRRTTYAYDALGRLTETRNHLDNGYVANIQKFDLLDRVIEERKEDQSGTVFNKVEYGYDDDNNRSIIITHNQAGSSAKITRYNANREIIEIQDALGNKTINKINHLSFTKGVVGPLYISTDPLGNITKTSMDPRGNITKIETTNSFGVVAKRQEVLYNTKGFKTKHIETVFDGGKQTKTIVTCWAYDSCGRMISQTESFESPDQKITSFTYNNIGCIQEIIKPNGIKLFHEYDSLKRLSRCVSSDGTIDYTYEYDLNSNPICIEDHIYGGKTKKIFNVHNQVTDEQLANDLCLSNDYDKLGRQTSLILPDQSQVEYNWESYHLKSILRYDVDKIYQYSHAYDSYDLSGQVMQMTMIGKAGEYHASRNILGQVTCIETPSWTERIDKYDALGNVLSKVIISSQGQQAGNYEYDDLQQLKAENGHISHTYRHDSLHNRLVKDQSQYSVNSLNQLTHDGESRYEFDLNGRMVKKITGNDTMKFSYDALDRLQCVTNNDEEYHYGYDSDNRRLSKTHYLLNGNQKEKIKTIRYLYNGQNEIGAVEEDDRVIELRVLGKGLGAEIGAAVAIEIGGKVYAPVHDANGNVRSLLDSQTGEAEEVYCYSAFGEEKVYDRFGRLCNDSLNPWRFSSKRMDEETGFVYFGRRYYSPEIGRWITKDPLGFEGGPNLYAYVKNNPLILIDLFGLIGFPPTKVKYENRSIASRHTIGIYSFANKGIGYTNGMGNIFSDACSTSQYFSELANGHNIDLVFNPTTGNPIRDIER